MLCRPTSIHLEDFCRNKKCYQYIEWEYDDHDGPPHNMCSCQIIGQSYNVNAIPENCVYLKDIKEYELMTLLGAEIEYWN